MVRKLAERKRREAGDTSDNSSVRATSDRELFARMGNNVNVRTVKP